LGQGNSSGVAHESIRLVISERGAGRPGGYAAIVAGSGRASSTGSESKVDLVLRSAMISFLADGSMAWVGAGHGTAIAAYPRDLAARAPEWRGYNSLMTALVPDMFHPSPHPTEHPAMTQSGITNPNLPLDPATLRSMLRSTIDAVPHDPDASVEELTNLRDAAFTVIAALRPRDPLEALFAARCVVAHYQLMDNFRCAAQRNLPPSLVLRYQGRAVELSRLMDGTMQDLRRRQAYPALQPTAEPVQAPSPAAQPTQAEPAQAQPAQPPTPAATAVQPGAPTPPPAPALQPAASAPAPQQGQAPQANGSVQSDANAAMLQLMLTEIAARAATSIPALAA
jgi:hypothetical protein